VLGQFFLVRQEIGLERLVFLGRRPAFAGAGDGADGDLAAKHPHEDLGGGPDHLEAAEIEEEHERRGVGAAQGAVEREGRQREGLGPALARHDLEDIARADVVLRLFHRREVIGAREVGNRLGRFGHLAEIMRGGRLAFEIAQRVHHPFGGLRIGGAGGQPAALEPFTPSSTATTEGRIIIASGRPSGSGFTFGRCSTRRIMS